jgi:hypothetical protein
VARRGLILAVVLAMAAYGGWHYFVQTLSLSQVVGGSSSVQTRLIAHFLDFDTGLTRYDMAHLRRKSVEWEVRRTEISIMTDSAVRQGAEQEFALEILSDPSVKKINRRLLSGVASVFDFVKLVSP